MAPIENKRPQKEESSNSRKRQRITQEHGPPQGKAGLGSKGLDALPWNEVALPDRLDDAEGFLGLEEASGVEIVRDLSVGKVEYRISSCKNGKKTREDTPSNARDSLSTVDAGTVDLNWREKEWEGFEPEDGSGKESPDTVEASQEQTSSKEARKAEIKALKRQERRSGKQNINSVQTVSNPFEALDEAIEEEADVSAWHFLDLSSATLSSIARLNFTSPTPIQSSAIPEIISGHDVIGKASTGSGKTLAFGIPILEYYLNTRDEEEQDVRDGSKARKRPLIALILSPTRELAHQLSAHLSDLCSTATTTGPIIATVTGGLSMHKQQRLLAKADIIIGTPGRLWEIISDSHDLASRLKRIKYMVVDEADRLLSEGHFKEVEEILNTLDRADPDHAKESEDGDEVPDPKTERQILVFSATFQKDLQQKLAGKNKHAGNELMGKQESMEYLLKKLNFREDKPKFIDVNPVSQMASGLKEGIIECPGLDKDLYLYALLLHHPKTRTLIFTNSITSVRRLTPFLQNLNIPAHALHSQMPQKARLRSIERFSSSFTPGSILIATDIAARGLDIPFVQLIIHYHVPRAADMYVHRSGRTARADREGSSILLCAPEEVLGVRRLIAKVHARHAPSLENKNFYIHTLDLDRRIIARLKSRVTLSKRIADASLAKEKSSHEENWLRTAASDLGVDYDSEKFAAAEEGAKGKKGRGQGRKKAKKEARGLSKAEVGGLRAELKGLLGLRVNVGVSERYLTAGGVDVDELLEGQKGEFLGRVDGVGEW